MFFLEHKIVVETNRQIDNIGIEKFNMELSINSVNSGRKTLVNESVDLLLKFWVTEKQNLFQVMTMIKEELKTQGVKSILLSNVQINIIVL